MVFYIWAQEQTSVVAVVLLSTTSAISSILALCRPICHATQFVAFRVRRVGDAI